MRPIRSLFSATTFLSHDKNIKKNECCCRNFATSRAPTISSHPPATAPQQPAPTQTAHSPPHSRPAAAPPPQPKPSSRPAQMPTPSPKTTQAAHSSARAGPQTMTSSSALPGRAVTTGCPALRTEPAALQRPKGGNQRCVSSSGLHCKLIGLKYVQDCLANTGSRIFSGQAACQHAESIKG